MVPEEGGTGSFLRVRPTPRGWGRDVLERPYAEGEGGVAPPPPPTPFPPTLPFQYLRLTAKSLLRRQENLSLKIFGLPSVGAPPPPFRYRGLVPNPPALQGPPPPF